jgi:hypothetical protein
MSHKFPASLILVFIIAACTPAVPGPIPTISAVAPGVIPDFIPTVTSVTATSPAPTSAATFTPLPPTATPGTVASSSKTCSSARSVAGSTLTSITFINRSSRAVNVYWIDYEGSEKFWFELQPDEALKQETYVTHPWCARDKTTGAPLLAVVATEEEQVATVPAVATTEDEQMAMGLGEIEWQQTTALPIASSAPFDSLRAQPLIFHNGRVYMFGGRSASDERLTNVYFSAIQPEGALAEWQETTPLPGKYYDHVAVKLGDYVYLLTGADNVDDVYFAPFNADGSLGDWKETALLSPSRQTFAAGSYGNFIYATGGNSGGTKKFVQFTSANADGSLNPWENTTPLPEAVQEHMMIAYDGYLYVIGGRNEKDAWQTTIYFSAIHPDGTLADWKTTTPLPPRALLGSAVFESAGYLYLLSDGSAYYTHILESHKLSEWQPIASLPAVRSGVRVGAHNGYAYAIGGSDYTGHQSTVYHSWLGTVVEPLDCTSGWTRLKAGSYAKVSEENPSPNRVREAPDSDAKIIYQIYPGSILQVVEGPICADGLVFWNVENSLIPGGAGWTAEGDGKEYFLEPIQ